MARRSDDGAIGAALEALYERAADAGLRPMPVAGVSLGGCCEAIGTERRGAFRRKAHAHTAATDPHRDWICILSDKESRAVTATGRATALLIHEYAHIVTHSGHTAAWGKAVAALGAPNEAKRYRARHRHAWSEWDERDNGQSHRTCLTCTMTETWFGTHPQRKAAS